MVKLLTQKLVVVLLVVLLLGAVGTATAEAGCLGKGVGRRVGKVLRVLLPPYHR
jgi:hypothetical protein